MKPKLSLRLLHGGSSLVFSTALATATLAVGGKLFARLNVVVTP